MSDFIFSRLVFNCCLTSSDPAANSLSNSRLHLTFAWYPWKQHPFLLIPHLLRIFGTSGVFFFFRVILITVVIHMWLADLQPVFKLLRSRLAASVDSQSAVSSSFFLLSLLPQTFTSHSFNNLGLPYHVTEGKWQDFKCWYYVTCL